LQDRCLQSEVEQWRRARRKDVRFAGNHCVEPALGIEFTGPQQRPATVGDGQADDLGIVGRERRLPRESQVQCLQTELQRLQRVLPPVRLGVISRVGVLDRHAGPACLETITRAQMRIEIQQLATAPSAPTVQCDALVGSEIEKTRPGTLVGVDHRAAARQAPGATDTDSAVDPARAGHRTDDQAARLAVELIRHLRQQPVRLPRTWNPSEAVIFTPWHRRYRAINAAESSARTQIDDSAPVLLDRTTAQLRRGRMVGKLGCADGAAQTIQPQSGRKQIVVSAVFSDAQLALQEVHLFRLHWRRHQA
jgi:hypothetical protein